VSTIASLNVALALDDRDFSAGIARAQGSAESFSKKLGGLGQTMSLAVTAPLVGIAAAAVHSAGKFEQSMNVMGQVTGATASEMEALQAQALHLGAVTSFSAGEAADAMLELGKAGLAPNEIMGAISGTMDLAAAGGLDLAQSATIAANAMNAFHLPAEEVTDVANMLAAAANASSVEVTDLAAGMQMAGSIFASNGQSVEDLTTAMAILGNNAISGSDAGTSLKTMLMRLSAPTDEAAGVMADLGIQVFNADGSMRGFADIVGSLETATTDLTDQQRSMALTTLFGADAIRAATILASEGADGFADMSKAVNKQGAAAATANARMKGIGGAIEYLKGSIDSFLIEAALPFLDTLSGFVRGAADFLSMIGELPEPVRNTALAIAAVAAAAGPVLLIVSKLVPMFSMFGTVMGVIVSPIGLVVAAVTALVAVFATDFMGIRTAVMGFVDSLIEMSGIDLGGIIEGFKSFGSYIGIVLEDGDYLNDWLTHLPTAIQPVVEKLGGLIATLTSDMSLGEKIGAIQADISALFTEITALDWGGAWEAFQTWLDEWAGAVVSEVQKIDWGGAIETAGNMFAVLSNVVVYHLKKIPWNDYIGQAGDLFWQLKDAVIAAVKAIPWGEITLPTPPAKMTAGEADAAILAGVTKLDAEFSSQIAGMFDGLTEQVKGTDFTPILTNWLTSITTALNENDWSSIGATFGAQLTEVFSPANLENNTTAAFDNLETAIADGIAGIDWTKVKEKLAEIDTVFAEGLGEFGEAFSGTFEAPEWMQSFIDWTMPPPDDWMDAFLAWAIAKPTFMDNFLSWTIAKPEWMDAFLDWFPETPGWVNQLLGWRPPSLGAGNPYVPPTPSPYGGFTPGLPPVGVNTPLPNNRGAPIDITPPPPSGIMGDTSRSGNIIGAVYVNNNVDVNELAYKVAQANGRRFA
jgi:TP901 family phage tail tape measure protein